MKFEILTWAITLVSVAGAFLNVKKKVSCFYFWIAANTSWVIIDLQKGMYAQAALFLFYTLMCFYGIYSWRGDK